MALIDSKQLNPALTGSFTLSGSLSGTSIIAAAAIDGQLGIFSPTGSIQSTHNDLVITGSVTSSLGFKGDGSGITVITKWYKWTTWYILTYWFNTIYTW